MLLTQESLLFLIKIGLDSTMVMDPRNRIRERWHDGLPFSSFFSARDEENRLSPEITEGNKADCFCLARVAEEKRGAVRHAG